MFVLELCYVFVPLELVLIWLYFLKLTGARDTVNAELEKLNTSGDECIQTLNKTFQEIHDAVDQRKNELIAKILETKENKKAILNEQLILIEDEKKKVSDQIFFLKYFIFKLLTNSIVLRLKKYAMA